MGGSNALFALLRLCGLVEPTGFEPVTSALPGRRSCQLSYGPVCQLSEAIAFQINL